MVTYDDLKDAKEASPKWVEEVKIVVEDILNFLKDKPAPEVEYHSFCNKSPQFSERIMDLAYVEATKVLSVYDDIVYKEKDGRTYVTIPDSTKDLIEAFGEDGEDGVKIHTMNLVECFKPAILDMATYEELKDNGTEFSFRLLKTKTKFRKPKN